MSKRDLIVAICLILTTFLAGTVIYLRLEIALLNEQYVGLREDYDQLRANYFDVSSSFQKLAADYDRLHLEYLHTRAALQELAEHEVFALAENNVRCEVWPGFNNDGVGESNFTDYRFKMRINDTSGGWALSKVCRGLMPHGWGLRYAPVKEIEISRSDPLDVTLDITLKLVDFGNYTATNSSMNVAICFFFDGYTVDYQEACFQTEMQFFSYYGDRIQTNQTSSFTWRGDNVTQVKLADNLEKGKIKHYEMNITRHIIDMADHNKLERLRLKHIEIFTEAYKGYSEIELFHCRITARNVID